MVIQICIMLIEYALPPINQGAETLVLILRFICSSYLLILTVTTSFASGKSSNLSSTPRAGHLMRPTSPKSPVASASAFESIEGSDDEDNMTDTAKLDTAYLHTNGNAVSKGAIQEMLS